MVEDLGRDRADTTACRAHSDLSWWRFGTDERWLHAAFDHKCYGTALERFGGIIVAIDGGPGNADEEMAGLNRARILRDTGDVQVIGARGGE